MRAESAAGRVGTSSLSQPPLLGVSNLVVEVEEEEGITLIHGRGGGHPVIHLYHINIRTPTVTKRLSTSQGQASSCRTVLEHVSTCTLSLGLLELGLISFVLIKMRASTVRQVRSIFSFCIVLKI